MSTKNESVLGLMPPNSPPTLHVGGWIDEPGVGKALTTREQTIRDRHHEQMLVIDATGCKTRFGMAVMGDLERHAAIEFADVATCIDGLKADAKGTESEAPVEEFGLCLMQVSARHLLGVVEVGDAAIGSVVRASLDPPPEAPPSPPKRGLLARLFGG